MVDVVLSYSGKDRLIGEELYQTLRQAEFDVWDFPQMQPGKKLMDEWFRVLREAQILIVLISPTSTHPSSTYVYQAWNYFLVQQKTIIPLILPNTSEENIPDELSAIFYLDLRDNDIAASASPVPQRPVKRSGTQESSQLISGTQIERLMEALRNVLSRPESERSLIEFTNVGMLTPESLDNVLMPYIKALSSLQDMMDQVEGKKVQPHRISQIVHYNPTILEILGLDPVINTILDLVVPYRRKIVAEQLKKTQAETESVRTQTRKIQAETDGIELDNLKKILELKDTDLESYFIAKKMIERLEAPTSSPEGRQFLANQMAPHVRTLLESSIEARFANESELGAGWRRVT